MIISFDSIMAIIGYSLNTKNFYKKFMSFKTRVLCTDVLSGASEKSRGTNDNSAKRTGKGVLWAIKIKQANRFELPRHSFPGGTGLYA